ncbi:hypothetical protein [Fulvivirga ligni]|uniref:hypothetical protein n=1 Tax=Fulvivirga ligni TaxID=2904246 RepID=UPI001F32A524|nr:hypothetical protein [Fulvivirga ligni]UII21098.1 hypothetical protein LVD16_24990 [Fulvivirga ligni]
MKGLFLAITLLLSLCFHYSSEAQNLWAHTGISMAAYKGDLSSYDQYRGLFQVGVQLNKKKRLNGNFNLGIGSVSGENRDFRRFETGDIEPNRYFRTNFFFLNYDLHYNIVKTDFLIVYVSQGIGFFRFTPKDDEGNSLIDQGNTRNPDESYRNSTFMLPTSAGATYFLPNKYGIGLQAGFLNPLTDYLDNISELGETGGDNILEFRFSLYVPIKN